MAEFPAMPLWTDAYLGDTTHLTTIEHGAYLLLLIVTWRSRDNRLPDDDTLLARYAKLTRGQWARMRPILADFFDIDGGFWTQRRLTDEAEAVRQRRESQAAAGRASALKRKGRHATKRQRSANGAQTPLPLPTSVDKSTGGKPPDPIKEIFDLGVALLVETGTEESQARSLIGKWRKETKSDAAVLDGLIECRARNIAEPKEWLTKRFKPPKYVSASGYEYRGSLETIEREAKRRHDMDTYWQIQIDKRGQPNA